MWPCLLDLRVRKARLCEQQSILGSAVRVFSFAIHRLYFTVSLVITLSCPQCQKGLIDEFLSCPYCCLELTGRLGGIGLAEMFGEVELGGKLFHLRAQERICQVGRKLGFIT